MKRTPLFITVISLIGLWVNCSEPPPEEDINQSLASQACPDGSTPNETTPCTNETATQLDNSGTSTPSPLPEDGSQEGRAASEFQLPEKSMPTAPPEMGASDKPSQATTGKPEDILWDDRFKPYPSFKLNKAKKHTVLSSSSKATFFSCPGDSFVVGMNSNYDAQAKDRITSVVCQFLMDGNASPVQKGSCEQSEAANRVEEKLSFSCKEESYLAGFASWYAGGDRVYQFECCEAVNLEKQKAKILEAENQSGVVAPACTAPAYANPLKGDLEFACESPTIISRVDAEYFSGGDSLGSIILESSNDRRFGFKCCQVGFTH